MINLYHDPRMENISTKIINLAKTILLDVNSKFSNSNLAKIKDGNRKLRNKYIYEIFKNWKNAQKQIINIQLSLWKECPNFQSDPLLLYFYRNTQRLLDCIIWHHYGPDITDIKRLYQLEAKIENLFQHNILTHIEIMEKFNSSTHQFALISDLTSGIRIGDLFVVNRDKEINFIEIKEGSVNEEIFKAKNSDSLELLRKLNENPDTKKQINRIERQENRAKEIIKSLKNEPAEDDRFKNKIVITQVNQRPFEDFSKTLNDFLFNFSNCSHSLIDSIDIESCLLVIVYKPIPVNVKIRNQLILNYENDSNPRGLIYNWLEILTTSPIARPLFIQPIDSECINSLIRGDLIVDFYFSISRFKSKFNTINRKLFFNNGTLFRKNYNSLKQDQGKSYFYEKNNGSLFFNFKDINPSLNIIFSEGLFLRVLSNLILPSYLIYLHEFMARSMDTAKFQKDDR